MSTGCCDRTGDFPTTRLCGIAHSHCGPRRRTVPGVHPYGTKSTPWTHPRTGPVLRGGPWRNGILHTAPGCVFRQGENGSCHDRTGVTSMMPSRDMFHIRTASFRQTVPCARLRGTRCIPSAVPSGTASCFLPLLFLRHGIGRTTRRYVRRSGGNALNHVRGP